MNQLRKQSFSKIVLGTAFIFICLTFGVTADAQEVVSEEEYRSRIGKLSSDHSTALNSMSTIIQSKPHPNLWTTDEMVRVAADTVIIENSYAELQKTAPPEKFKEAHSLLSQGLQKHAEAMPLLRQGVDTLNANLINQATAKLQEGTALVQQATDKVNAINAASPAEPKKDSECFVATAAYGTPYAQDIDVLRDVRDNSLRQNYFGQQFIRGYYKAGPLAADVIRDRPILKFAVREVYIKPLVKATEFFQSVF